MSEDMEVSVTVTPEDMEFRARAKAAGLPDVLISVYGTALRRLVADERERIRAANAPVIKNIHHSIDEMVAASLAAIHAVRSKE